MKYCNSCEEQIDVRRVKANPATELCINCQAGLEKSGAFQRHKMDVQTHTRCGEADITTHTIVKNAVAKTQGWGVR